MTIRVIDELGAGGTLAAGLSGSIRLPHTILGVSTPENAITALVEWLKLMTGVDPPMRGSLVLNDVQVDELVPGGYKCVSSWKTFQGRQPPAMGESQFNFEMSLNSVQIKVPVAPISVYKAPGSEDWSPQLLNDQGNGEEVEGVEIFEPTYEESETHWGPTAALTPAYRNILKSCVGKTNATWWKGHAPGEVLMRGISGTRRGMNDSELTFRWSVRENQTGLMVGTVTGINKEGWQYLWPRAKTVKQGNGPASNVITHVCVATVFRSRDLTIMGIGA